MRSDPKLFDASDPDPKLCENSDPYRYTVDPDPKKIRKILISKQHLPSLQFSVHSFKTGGVGTCSEFRSNC